MRDGKRKILCENYSKGSCTFLSKSVSVKTELDNECENNFQMVRLHSRSSLFPPTQCRPERVRSSLSLSSQIFEESRNGRLLSASELRDRMAMWVMPINRGTNYISVFYWVYQFITINIYNRFSRLPRAIRIQICTKPRVGGTRGRSNNFPRSGNAARIDNDFHCYGSFLAQRACAWPHEASTTRTHVNMKKTHWRRCSRSTIALLGSVVRSSSYSLFASNGRACFIHHAWRVARHSDSDGQASAVTTNSITTFRHLRPPTGFGVGLQPYGTHCYYLSIPLCSRFQHAESDFLGPMKEKS